MSKKKKSKTQWVSNNYTDPSTEFMSASDLDALIDQEYGLNQPTPAPTFTPNPTGTSHLPEGLRNIIKQSAEEAYHEEAGTERPQSFEDVISGMYTKKGIDLSSAPKPAQTVSVPETPQYQIDVHTEEAASTGDTTTVETVDEEESCDIRCVKIITDEKTKRNDILITDGSGNAVTIPIANESDNDYSIVNLIKNIAAMNNVTTDAVTEDTITGALYDLASTMAQVQILWGKPTFVADMSDLDDDLSDDGVKSYDGTKLVILYPCEDAVGGGGTVYGYTFTDMTDLTNQWYSIIKTYFDMGDNEYLDRILISLQLAYQVMITRRYVGYDELGMYIGDYLITNDRTMSAPYTHYFTEIAPADQAADEMFVIKWNHDISEVINQSIESIIYGDAHEVLQMYFDHSDQFAGNDDDESDSETEDGSYDDSDDQEETRSDVSSNVDPIAMAESFANEYMARHPELSGNQEQSTIPQPRGYVQNPESEGAPVGENDFRNVSNAEVVNTEETDVNSGTSEERGYSNGNTQSSTTETNQDPADRGENGTTTTNRSWDPSVSDYTGSSKEEAQEEEKEEGNGHGHSNGIKKLQEAPKEVDEDDLIVNVSRG